jgi:hypothetical protein
MLTRRLRCECSICRADRIVDAVCRIGGLIVGAALAVAALYVVLLYAGVFAGLAAD